MIPFLLGHRRFNDESQIIEYVTFSERYENEPLASARALRIFQTNVQITWLVATVRRLYCILDDIRGEGPHIIWSLGRSEIFQNGQFALRIQIHEPADPKKRDRVGFINFGPRHQNWYYSKSIFSVETVTYTIRHFIESVMVNPRLDS